MENHTINLMTLRITYVAINKTLMDNLKKWRANFY